MKIWKQLLIFLTVLAGLCSSCSNSQPQSISQTATIFPVASTPTNTPNTPIAREDFSCWPVKPLLEGNNIKGSLLYANFPYAPGNQQANGLFVWEINKFQNTSINFSPYLLKTGEIYQSPDGKLATLISENNLLIISQESTQSFPLPIENLKIETYLPDGHILLVQPHHQINYYQEDKGFKNIYYIFDPATGRTTRNEVFLPKLAPSEDIWFLQYSSDMKYALYGSLSSGTDSAFTLYDLQKGKIIWIGPRHNSSLINIAIPTWQPDSSMLTTIYNDETGTRNYYSISLEGIVSPMHIFNSAELYEATRSNKWKSFDAAESPNWSPNGKYLASEGYAKDSYRELSTLYIWDEQKETLYKPCLPEETKRITVLHNIIWSFDGLYALVEMTFLRSATPVEVVPGLLSPDYISKRYILDLVNRIIYEVPEDQNDNIFLSKEGHNEFLCWVNWEIP
ncbi:MAG: hypothetical protein HYZ25_09190 [Chloroflexi bacterium]|nr:hypothetical protein [Chloroflexota bacterium]